MQKRLQQRNKKRDDKMMKTDECINRILRFCKSNCNREMTVEEVLTDTDKCNFCDVPYIILQIQQEGE